MPSTTVPAPVQKFESNLPSTRNIETQPTENTAPGGLQLPNVDQGAFYRPFERNLGPQSQRTGSIDDILKRADVARRERLQSAASVVEKKKSEADPKAVPKAVPTLLPSKLPKVNIEKDFAPAARALKDKLPKIRNLAEVETPSIVLKENEPKEVEAKDVEVKEVEVEKVAETSSTPNTVSNDFASPETKTPEIKTPTPSEEVVKVEEPAVPQKPIRSEEEIIKELRNTTVPHSVVFDSSPIIPEQNMPRPRKSTEPTIEPTIEPKDEAVVLRARPVESFQGPVFNQDRKVAIDIAPPPALRVAGLRPQSNSVDQKPDAEYLVQRTPRVRVEPQRIPMLQASATLEPVKIEEVLEQPRYNMEPLPLPHFTVEPLPLTEEFYLSPEGVPLEQISEEPVSIELGLDLQTTDTQTTDLPTLGMSNSVASPEFSSLPLVGQGEVTSKPETLILKAEVREHVLNRGAPNFNQSQTATELPDPMTEQQTTPAPSDQHQQVFRQQEILRLRAAPTNNGDVYSNASSAAKIRFLKPKYQYDRGQQQRKQNSESPNLQLQNQQRGQPIFDYDRIKDEINRLSKRPGSRDTQDR